MLYVHFKYLGYMYSLIRGKVSRQVGVLVCEYRTGSYYLLPPSKIRRRSWRVLLLYTQLHMHARWVANSSLDPVVDTPYMYLSAGI